MQARVADHPINIVKPFMLIGALFFATGFLGYLSLVGIPA